MLFTTMIMTFTVGVDLGFVLGCFLLIFYHIASMNQMVASGLVHSPAIHKEANRRHAHTEASRLFFVNGAATI